MTVKEFKSLLDNFDDSAPIILWAEHREGHDDAVMDFGVKLVYGNDEKSPDDVRKTAKNEEYSEDDSVYTPCVAISFSK
jgi:hypothetical protein